jgi:hypothetical protein
MHTDVGGLRLASTAGEETPGTSLAVDNYGAGVTWAENAPDS